MKRLADHPSQGSVLVLIRELMPELGYFLRACQQIADEGWSFAFLIPPEIKGFCEQSFGTELAHQSFHFLKVENFPRILARISDFQAILLPVLTFSFSEAILALKDDDNFVQCVIQALMRNQRVLALTTAMQPVSPAKNMQSSELEIEAQKRFEGLREMKIELASLESLSLVLGEKNRVFEQKLIAEDDILALPDGVTELRVGKKTIITPLAVDRANERSINIIRE
ncbi:MAG: hypothetical protein ACXACI_06570 [Candidatus Hodarchaeales archaeon]